MQDISLSGGICSVWNPALIQKPGRNFEVLERRTKWEKFRENQFKQIENDKQVSKT
jgi:hypothetical protein